MNNTGTDYEIFVQKLIQAIIDSETAIGQKNIIVRHNEKILDKNGKPRQFDVLWDYELGGVIYKTIIECKDYNSNISVEKVDALIGKLADFPGVRGIIATNKGYQKGAKEKAKKHNIELLRIREQNDEDWIDSDGTPLIRTVKINIHMLQPPEIIQCNTFLDKEYIQENHIDKNKIDFSSSLNTDIFITDIEKHTKYSLYDLQDKIADKNEHYGIYEKDINFNEAFISDKNICVKLKKLHIKYKIKPPVETSVDIDFSKELLGVVEYLSQNKKKIVLRNGNIRTENIYQPKK